MAPFSAALTALLLLSSVSATIKDHCTDISYWDVIKYESTTKQCCDTKLQQVCITKNDQVCTDVLELNCDVVAWGECLSTPTSIESTKCSVQYHDFAHQKCEETKTSVKHTKKVPECKEVTKNNCVTDWEVDENGNKVWAGTETCTPVTWEECDIVEKTVDFPTVKTECGVDSQIKWMDFVDTTRNIAGLESKCQVKKAVNCEHVVVNKCAPVVWQECKMEPREECRAVIIHTPSQEKIHQKKCLTGDQAYPEFKAGIVYPGKEFSEISSPNGEYSCEMQPDGRFVVTTREGKIVWSTETAGSGLQFEFRVDGTLCVHDQHGTLVWSAGTFGEDADRLVLENDGFLVLYSKTGAVLWTSQPHKLLRGQTMKAGYSMVSPHGLYTLTMQNDGNLVLSSTHGTETWTVGVEELGAGAYLQFHSDGNLVLYGADHVDRWDTDSTGSKAKALVLKDDGQLELCCKEDGEPVWTAPVHCYAGSTGDDRMECANGLFGEKWSGCVDQGSYRVRCPKNSSPCNDPATTGVEFSCWEDCSTHGGDRSCSLGNFIREGSYELVTGGESLIVEIKSVGGNWVWSNQAGQSWTLYPTSEINVLRVGEDSPFYARASANHRVSVFNAAGVSGPNGEFYAFKAEKVGCPLAQLDVATGNAINNNLLSFVKVTLSQDGKVVDRLTTDQTAKGQFNSPHGQVVLTAELDGFVMAPVLLRVASNECEKMIKLSLSPEYTGAARVVMNWGRNPQDLDLHVKQLRNGREVCHSFYDNKNCGGFALDVDNRLGGDNGAETMTFTALDADSEYIVFVYDYTVKNTPSYLPASQSRVAFYREGYAPTQISVPTTETDPLKKWWMVACFNYKGEFVGTNRNLLMSSEPTECSPSERFLRIPSRLHPDF